MVGRTEYGSITSKRVVRGQPIFKMGVSKKKNGLNGDGETLLTKSDDTPSTPKVSVRQLFRYASCSDILLIFVGIIVSIGTGLGWPLMSVVMGNISRNFMTIGTRLGSNYTEDELPLIYEDFNRDAMKSCIAYLYLGCGVFIVGTLQAVCFLTVSENVVNRLRREFFKGILRQDVTWFDQNNSGTVATKLFDNIERVKEGTGDKLGLMLQYIAQFFGGFAVAFLYDWKLTLIMMSLTPFMIISGATIAKIMSSAATREAKKYAVAGGIAEEVLTSMRTVIAFNGQERESQRYEKALEAGKLIGIKKALFQGAGMGMMFFIMFSSYCLAFWVGTNFVYEGRMDGGTVMTVFFAVMLGSMALGQAGPQFAVLGTALGAAGALYQTIDRTPEIDSYSTSGLKPKDMKGKLVVKDLRFTYPTRKDVKVLKGVSFEANPGETIALVGSSGCGKSTIIQLLLRYYDPESGSITIDGVEINKLNIDFLRNFIGVVSQEPTLFNTTIEQNIRYGNWDVTDAELTSALRRANAYNFIKSFPDGIKTLVGDHGTQMSGGQKQRIAIARALVRDPKILLLDEATSALDAESEHIVQQALENASKGRTTIVIAHRLSTIRNADKIIAMKGGEVVECGTHEELLSRKGLYHDLVNSQVFVDNVKEESDTVKRMESVLSARSQASTTDGKETHRMKSQFSDSPDQSEDTSTKKNPAKDLERLKKELEAEGAAKASLWKIVAYARSEWPLLLLAILCACLMGCVMPVFSILFTQIIAVFSNPDPEQMKADGHVLALMFLALGISQGLFIMGQAFFFGLSAERITLRFRSKVFRNIMRMDGAYFDMPTHSPGKITTRLATDAPNVKSAIDYRLGTVFNSAIAICFGLAIAFYFGWQMAVVVLAIFPLAGVGRSIQIKYVSGNAGSDAAEMENSGKVAMEAIENVRTVQALTLEKRLYSQFCSHLDRPHRNNQRKAIMQGFAYGFAASIIFFLYGASFRWGLWLIAHQYMTPIRVLRVLFAISFCAGSLGTASAYFPEYIKATFAAGLIFKMLEEEPGIDNLSKNGKKSEVSGKIELLNVFFRYPQRPEIPILQGLNLKVTPGETLALVGPSGCGKSTVISLLERLYDTLDGQVLIDETDIRELNPAHMRSHIALVSQEPLLFDTTIRKNITYGMEPESVNDEKVIEVAKKANIHSFIEQLSEGYDTRVGEKGTQLSGGQKQRIAIARALIRNPKILLLDEATSALDTESEQLVQSALDKASEGRTCIVVAHRLSTIVNANCIMVVSDGKVVEQGSHQELIAKRGAYYKLNQRQNLSA